jgi:hypothetical protein
MLHMYTSAPCHELPNPNSTAASSTQHGCSQLSSACGRPLSPPLRLRGRPAWPLHLHWGPAESTYSIDVHGTWCRNVGWLSQRTHLVASHVLLAFCSCPAAQLQPAVLGTTLQLGLIVHLPRHLRGPGAMTTCSSESYPCGTCVQHESKDRFNAMTHLTFSSDVWLCRCQIFLR